ncbi:Asp-tRNA(Asn)/Glu-tRNA(Gln) amidotransferase subunit GatA [Candidatus Woesearchaeota archaeon]|nr:Asp-tRNA(Asn)/Glu-tRNA(Gln) amidotransferase subunit GatA [Candidatus Woesearchaeota archaeon]
MSLSEFVYEVNRGDILPAEHVERVITPLNDSQQKFSHSITIPDSIRDQSAKAIKDKPLSGVAVSVKDNLCTAGIQSTAGSAILKGYIPVFNATAVQRCINAGAVIISKTAMDEFGFGGFNVNVGKGMPVPKNPHDPSRSCGGSSGGAGCLTASAAFPHAALAESTGGSIANPASFCGVVGICPTYSRVSRYGLIDYANSLDKVGTMGKTVQDAALLLDVIAGPDHNDSTCSQRPHEPMLPACGKSVHGMRIGVVKEFLGEGVAPEVKKQVWDALKRLEDQGATLCDISLPITAELGIAAYYLIAMAEASTNLAKYCGMRYGATLPLQGHFDEYFTKVRTEFFSSETKRRILLGTFARMAGYRDAYYLKALAARQMIIKEYHNAFKEIDAIASPVMPFIAPKFTELQKFTPLQNYLADIMTVGPNLAGLPHISVPAGKGKGMPVGLLLTTTHFDEKTAVQLASAVEPS